MPPQPPPPLAIIGFAAKYAQEADTAENFWNFLLQARESMTSFPKDRLNLDGYYHPDPEHAGSIHAKGAHFLAETPNAFDAAFFSVNKTEVLSLDPQQRLVMENVYHALENAGIPLATSISSNTSVFVSGFNHDHRDRISTDPDIALKHRPTGAEGSMISGRVSWFYDFKGASLTVDTACSSSMVAFHLACQNLVLGESETAIVSGVNVFGALNHILGMSYSGFLSSEGKCFTFDHRASGYSRGEGVGTIMLKTLDQALADGDTIRAVVRGTALNHDGRTPGLTYPSGEAQVRLVRELYGSVGLNPAETIYVESHGTGTPAGDPIEVASIAQAFECPVRGHPVYIGAVKPNIGHIEGGSGISGIIKAVMILESGVIPPNVNFEKVNPQILVDEWNVRFPLGEAIPWPGTGKRRISVNCFGLSGTNAHCILDDACHFLRENGLGGAHVTRTEPPTLNELRARVGTIGTQHEGVPVENGNAISKAPKLLLLSGFDQEAPKRLFDALLEYLKKKAHDSDSDQILSDLAYTLAEKRSRFRWNSFILCSSLTELVNSTTSIPPPVGNHKPPRIGFVFTGQGAQYAGMGQQLFQYPVFRTSIEAADAYMQNLGSHWSLLEEIEKEKESSRVDEAMISHPACTAIQIALVDLLHSWNIAPTRVVGHSSGEIAAAYCAGKISRQAAWNAAYHRGRLTSHIPDRVKGGMLAVGLDLAALQPLVEQVREQLPGELGVACFNSPKNNTVSGDEILLVVLQEMLEGQGVFVRRLRTPTAYHSPHMSDIADDYLEAMGQAPHGDMISHNHPLRMFSTSTGKEVVDDRLENEYWVHNLVSTVKFTTALRSMYRDDRSSTNAIDEVLEIGPHCALSSAIRETITDTGIGSFVYRATLDRRDPTAQILLSTTGALSVRGIPVNLHAVNQRDSDGDSDTSRTPPKMLVDLPPYPFDHRETGLYESRLTGFLRSRGEPRHFLLGTPTPDSKPSLWSWKNSLRLSENPWLKDHVIAGEIVFPGAGYLVMAIEAVRQIHKRTPGRITGFQIRDVALKAMLVIPDTKDGIETCTSVSPAEESALSTSTHWNKFVISSYNATSKEWTEHCTGYISVDTHTDPNPVTGGREQIADPEWKKAQNATEACTQPLDFSRVCDNLELIGVKFGPLFRNISSVHTSGEKQGIMRGTIFVPDVAATMPKGYANPHLIHPATLDAAIQAGVAAICDHVGSTALTRGKIPAFIKEMWISSDFPAQEQGTDLKCYGSAKLLSHDTYNFDIRVWDSSSQVGLLSLAGIRLTPFQSARAAAQENQLFHSIEWGPDANFLSDSMFDLSPPDDDSESEHIWFKELQLAAGLLAIDAIQELKGPLSPEAPDHYHRFYKLLKMVEADIINGAVALEIFSGWQEYAHDAVLKRELYERVSARDTNGAVLIRMGTNIVPFLQQTSDPLYHMFGQDDLMTRYYDADMEMGPIPGALNTILESVRFTHSGLRVLEVGAGTGSFSARVLSSLCPRDGEEDKVDCIALYDFTDVSPSFFEKAKVRLDKWTTLLSFKKLDLDEDPIKQRFVAESYDLIVASNVLHATEDLVLTLTRMRSLLKPGGKLLFLEGVRQDTIYSNISFSALPGWWLGKESVRQWCPYVPTEQWREYLNLSGFSGLDVTIPSSYYPEFNKVNVMLSTAITTPQATSLLRVAIVEPDNEGVTTKASATLVDILQAQTEIGDCTVSSLSELPLVDLHDVVCISLLELNGPMLDGLDPETFPQIKYLLTTCDRIIWVTGLTDPKHALSSGLIRTIRWERDSDTLNLITLAVNDGSTSLDVSNAVSRILNHQFINAGDRSEHWNAEYQLQSSTITTNRSAESKDAVEAINAQFTDPPAVLKKWSELERGVKIQIGEPGALDSLQWVTDNDADSPLGDNEVEVDIHAVGLNFRDLLTVMGELPQAAIGGEASGIVTRVGSNVDRVKVGDRVAYFGDPNFMGTFRTTGRAVQDLVVRIPDDSAFDVAASMPVIWTTVIYSLKHVANLTKSESILIHAAAGGVGQAAVQYAKLIGAEVFATVSTVEKKNLLVNEYGIPEGHIFSSRDLNFAAGLRQLASDGVDVILNSLAGEALRQSWACISHFGRFIEIGKRDLQTGGRLDMSPFLKNTTFSSVDLLTVAKHRPRIVARLLDDIIQLWGAGKISEPKPTSVVSYSSIQSALRSLQLGQSMGKIVCVPDDEPIPVIPERAEPYQLESNASYILAGGLGGIGRSIARWMASRGAKHLIFLSRSHQIAPAADELLSALEKLGCQSHVFSCNIADQKSLGDVVETVQTDPNIPPIKGLINCSVAWADSTFENMAHTQWQTSLEPKVQGSWNLHQALQSTSTDLGFFVTLSSVAGVVGNRSQANYNAGNTFEDALARYRVSQGLHGASIDLGAVVSVGFMAENLDYVKHSLKIATHHTEEQMLAIIDYVLRPDSRAGITESTAQLVCGLSTRAAYDRRGVPAPKHLQYPLFSHLQYTSASESAVTTTNGEQYNIHAKLAAATSEVEAVGVVLQGITKKLSSILSVAEDEVQPSRSIQENGVDSLIEMEFRTWCSKELGATLTKGDITTKSLEEISGKVMRASPYSLF
ncbi:hypothetical protein BDV19DRAFT_395631 [Aspergillus venezuelensis]